MLRQGSVLAKSVSVWRRVSVGKETMGGNCVTFRGKSEREGNEKAFGKIVSGR